MGTVVPRVVSLILLPPSSVFSVSNRWYACSFRFRSILFLGSIRMLAFLSIIRLKRCIIRGSIVTLSRNVLFLRVWRWESRFGLRWWLWRCIVSFITNDQNLTFFRFNRCRIRWSGWLRRSILSVPYVAIISFMPYSVADTPHRRRLVPSSCLIPFLIHSTTPSQLSIECLSLKSHSVKCKRKFAFPRTFP